MLINHFDLKTTLTNYFEDDLKFFENCFELPLSRPTHVRKQVLFNSCYFTTIPGGRPGGWAAGRVAGGIKIKANSVQFQLKLPTGTELGIV